MNARDVMTPGVIQVSPDTATRDIAKLLLEKGISAVPVVDGEGALVGMVSEGDLIGRGGTDHEARRDWWLTLLAEGETLSAEFLASVRDPEGRAKDIMAAPVVTVGEETDVGEIARLLAAYRIKRVPVIRDGRVVGIVSRADLLKALVGRQPSHAGSSRGGILAGALADLDHHFLRRQDPGSESGPSEPAPDSEGTALTAADLQRAMEAHEQAKTHDRDEEARAAAERREHKVTELLDKHVSDDRWGALMQQARKAAELGLKELTLLRFPGELCTDGGRAINLTEPGWPSTLRGEAAEIYLRWERDLKPRGFHLAARVLAFPGGMPGDIGLSLIWEQ